MRLFGNAVEQLSRGLSLASMRHGVLAQNIANVDTPGYRARDLVFDDTLKALAAPSGGQLSPQGPGAVVAGRTARVVATTDATARPDGNTVHLDHQMARIAENTLYQHTLVQLLAGQFNALKQAISGRV